MTPRLGAGGFVVFLAISLLVPARANACTAEGCPYQREGLGANTRRATVTLRFEQSTQDQLWSGTSEAQRDALMREMFFSSSTRHDAIELYTHTSAWILDGRARMHDRLEFTASVPYLQREHRHVLVHAPFYNPAFEDEWKYEGLGDAVALGHWRALGGRESASLTMQFGVKLPTGMRHVPDQEKTNLGLMSMLEPPVRPGTGSTDWLLGALAAQPLPWRGAQPVVASALARWNGVGAEDYRLGTQFQAGLGSGYQPVGWLTLLVQANYIGNLADSANETHMSAHPAQRALYLTPGATVRVTSALAVYALYQSRVWGRTNEATAVGQEQLLIGTAFTPGH